MKDYWIIDVEEEYPGYTGTEKWILITELAEEEFHTRHPEKSDLWKSSVVISKEMAKVMFCYDFNDRKHLQRSMETEDSMDEMELDVEDPGAQDTFLSLWVEEALNNKCYFDVTSALRSRRSGIRVPSGAPSKKPGEKGKNAFFSGFLFLFRKASPCTKLVLVLR